MMFRNLCFVFLLVAQSAFAQSYWSMTPHELRDKINQKVMSIAADTPEVYKVINETISNEQRKTPLRIYWPNDSKNLSMALLIHGGGWVAGNLDTHDHLARYLCKNANVVVVSVDYKNSPEGKFPLPLEQCYDALLWMVEHANELHGDPSKITVVGDSAGGNMSAALCLLDRDRNGPKIALQILINPAPDLTGGGTIKQQGDSKDDLRWFATQYVDNPEDANSPYVSPIMASSLKGLPSALVLLAENDALCVDGEKYADRLKADGVPTKVYIQKGVGHLAGDGARASIKAQESLNVAVDAIKNAYK